MPAAVVLDRAPRSESAGHLRRLPRLLVPAGTYCGLADWPTSLALIALFSCTGGMYACMSSSFAALADVTTGMDPTVRARKFGMAEGGIWLGLVAGPSPSYRRSDAALAAAMGRWMEPILALAALSSLLDMGTRF